MKHIRRISAVAATAALASPAFAAAGAHHGQNAVQTIIHWASQPTHGLPLLFAAAAVAAVVIYTRRQRG